MDGGVVPVEAGRGEAVRTRKPVLGEGDKATESQILAGLTTHYR